MSRNAASSTYHSGQLKLERSFSAGLSVLTSYTWAKSIDNASDFGSSDASERVLDSANLALQRAGKTVDDIDLFEINEAFAAQVIPSYKDVGIPLDKLNVHGGAIAVGHPFGMTGARITGTLINGLQTRDGRFGVESMCVGGGMGMAMVIERLG